MLERAGFEVVAEARDGREAVALAEEHRPDLAVMDVKMPELDGIEAARRMLEQRQIPIVMLTAFSEAALVGRAVDAGVFGYLVKPRATCCPRSRRRGPDTPSCRRCATRPDRCATRWRRAS